jgi:hypothetical protein
VREDRPARDRVARQRAHAGVLEVRLAARDERDREDLEVRGLRRAREQPDAVQRPRLRRPGVLRERQQVVLHGSVVEHGRGPLAPAEEREAVGDRALVLDVRRRADPGHPRVRARAHEEPGPGRERALPHVDGQAAEQHAAPPALGLEERQAQRALDRLQLDAREPGRGGRRERTPFRVRLGEAPRDPLAGRGRSGRARHARARELEVEVDQRRGRRRGLLGGPARAEERGRQGGDPGEDGGAV